MIKYLLGWAMAFIGFIFTLIILATSFHEGKTTFDFIIFSIFAIPFLLMLFFGVKFIANHLIKKVKDAPKVIPEKDILIEWEVSGTAWEKFREKKCSPILTFVYSASFTLTIIIGFIVYTNLTSKYDDNSSEDGAIIGTILISVVIMLYFLIYYSWYKIYGRLYKLKKCYVKISADFIDFNGKLMHLNDEGYRVRGMKINKKSGYNTLFVFRDTYSYKNRRFFDNFTVPLANEKIKDMEALLPRFKKKFFEY